MSEFQYVGFRAIDKPLSDKQLEYMERQSSRAEISRWSFENSYHFGDFGGNANEMLRRGYDIHLHYANFGIRRLSLRLPHCLGLGLSKKELAMYVDGDAVTWKVGSKNPAGTLTISPSFESGCGEELWELNRYLDRLVGLRQQLMDGDLRPLYVGWLCACQDGSVDADSATEPPVPAGLAEPSGQMVAMLEFFDIDESILAAAAEKSPRLVPQEEQREAIEGWLRGVDEETLRAWVLDFLDGNAAAARAQGLLAYRESRPGVRWEVAEGTRTFSEILATAEGGEGA